MPYNFLANSRQSFKITKVGQGELKTNNSSLQILSSNKVTKNLLEKESKLALLSALLKKDKLKMSANSKKLYTSYSKLSEMKLISISLASSSTMRQWAEKTLPNGKILGKVTTANTLHHKTFKPLKGGLFCERIFGPLKDFECACGTRQRPGEKEYRKILEHQQVERKFCPNCDVEYTWSIIRRYQMGYIELVSPVTHIWYLKANPSYLSILLDMKRKHLENIIYCAETSTLETAWKSSQNLNLEASLFFNFEKNISLPSSFQIKDKKNYLISKQKQNEEKTQLFLKATRLKNWRFPFKFQKTVSNHQHNQFSNSSNFLNVNSSPNEKSRFFNQKIDPNKNNLELVSISEEQFNFQNVFEKSNIFSKVEIKKRKEFLNILYKLIWQSLYKQAYRISQEKSNKLLVKLITKLKTKKPKHFLILKHFLKGGAPTFILKNRNSLNKSANSFTYSFIKGQKNSLTKKQKNTDFSSNVNTFKQDFHSFLEKQGPTVHEIPLHSLISFFTKLESLDLSFLLNKNLKKSLSFLIPIQKEPLLLSSLTKNNKNKAQASFKENNLKYFKTKKTLAFVDLEKKKKRILALKKMKGNWSVSENFLRFVKFLKYHFINNLLNSFNPLFETPSSKEMDRWTTIKNENFRFNIGGLDTKLTFNQYFKKYKNEDDKFGWMEDFSSSFLQENEFFVRSLANQLTNLLLIYNLKQTLFSILNPSIKTPISSMSLSAPNEKEKDFLFFEIIKSITKKELSLYSTPQRKSFLYKQNKENQKIFFEKEQYFGLNYSQFVSSPSNKTAKSSFVFNKTHKETKFKPSFNLVYLNSYFFLKNSKQKSWLNEKQKKNFYLKENQFFNPLLFLSDKLNFNSMPTNYYFTSSNSKLANQFKKLHQHKTIYNQKDNFITDVFVIKNQILAKKDYFLNNQNYVNQKNAFLNSSRNSNQFFFKKTKLPKIKKGFSLQNFKNNISCLSHRCRWKNDKNWLDFSNYFLAKRNFGDSIIPCYKNRVLNTIEWVSDNTIAGASIIQRLLLELNSNELRKMDKQNRILLYELTKKIQKLKSFVKRDVADKFDKKQLKEFCEQRDQLIRRTKLVRKLCRKNSNPASMILSILPILPPDLRPILKMQNQIAASDLNRLYQRVIYRNDRFKKFQKNPAISNSFEIKYSQRLLQEAVDNLIQNGKSGVTPERDSRGRLLKSLSEVLKGKQGRFRQYLLGKRVDYSGRSVIVVGPKLKLHECGLPIEMALELFLPFLIKRILHYKYARTVIGAKTLIKTNKSLTTQLLREVMEGHPVLLNRAPTLHRLGFQAFQPKLIEGRAILLHPLVCPSFNADFDGDQMAVHIPLTVEARAEAWKLMFSRNNLISPATGDPIMLPSQDMVLGCYYLTTEIIQKNLKENKKENIYFSSVEEVLKTYHLGKLKLHQSIWVKWSSSFSTANEISQPTEIRVDLNGFSQEIRFKYIRRFDSNRMLISQILRTTPGRILFNSVLEYCQKNQKRLSTN